ncbi:MAG: glycosyltransferase family 2 protein, partial [Desulfuromonadales bacterium]
MNTVTSAKIEIVIPLYNHGTSVRAVAMGALAQHPAVTVVDDGSTDGGAEQLHGLPVRLLRHPLNRGKGAAIMTALRDAAERGVTHLVTLDADRQHDPADLPKFLAAIAANPEAITVGCRDMTGTGVPGSSRFGRSFSNFWLRLQTGRSLGDTQSGYRAYPVAILTQLPLRQRRYDFEVEVL